MTLRTYLDWNATAPLRPEARQAVAAALELAGNPSSVHAEGAHPLVSVMLANNETGVVQPVARVAALAHAHGALLHVDAVQAAGRIAVDIKALQADLVTLSAHKIGGPQGVGALIKRDEALRLAPFIRGGGQERGQRGGTENVAGIAGFGAAAAVAVRDLAAGAGRMAALREALEHGLRQVEPATVIFGTAAERLPNTTLFTVAGLRAETAIIAFDLAGVALSSGAACSSGKVQPSHVLAAMGVDPALAQGAVRVSIGWDTNESDIERCLAAWRTVSGALLKRSREIAA